MGRDIGAAVQSDRLTVLFKLSLHEVPGPVFSWPETLAFQAVGLRCAKRVPFV